MIQKGRKMTGEVAGDERQGGGELRKESGKQLHIQQENAEEAFRFCQKQTTEDLSAVSMEC